MFSNEAQVIVVHSLRKKTHFNEGTLDLQPILSPGILIAAQYSSQEEITSKAIFIEQEEKKIELSDEDILDLYKARCEVRPVTDEKYSNSFFFF